ncbi:putative neural-cadherin 2 [Portunus trituberculatus]|uniref:Putative neural-cadherin 2 n=1 Tax=Portunus trituberculatus TaxID=210409 RepID=A0A5B7GP16_PORTR|nr:putative neural-cadherin 2 [Portunus trituberculatus]
MVIFRYQLSFWVSDAHHGQSNVEANVTVIVNSVSLDDLTCAVPVTVTSHPPGRLITPLKGSAQAPLEALRAAVQSVAKAGVEVVSVEADSDVGGTSGTRLWLTARSRHPLDQILLLHRKKISTQSSVTVMWVGVNMCVVPFASKRHPHDRMWVVDANTTALVTPRLQVPRSQCSCFPQASSLSRQRHKPVSLSGQPSVAAVTHIVSCHPNPCLNGGRCVLQARVSRCVCPEGTSGSICKQLSRHFTGNGWAWTAPLPSVNRAHISLEFLTLREEGLLLYAGPPDTPHLDVPLMQVISQKSL